MSSDKHEYLADGLRKGDGREGFGDDMGTRIGRPDDAQPAPRDASKKRPDGQAGTNNDAVADGIEGSIMDDDADEGEQQRRVRSATQDANDDVNPAPEAGNDRPVFDL
jgi:hypothetical protein